MPELNDRDTDALFQAGAERHDFEYNEVAWEQMESMLDADLAAGRWKLWGGGATGLIAIGLLIWAALGAGLFGDSTTTFASTTVDATVEADAAAKSSATTPASIDDASQTAADSRAANPAAVTNALTNEGITTTTTEDITATTTERDNAAGNTEANKLAANGSSSANYSAGRSSSITNEITVNASSPTNTPAATDGGVNKGSTVGGNTLATNSNSLYLTSDNVSSASEKEVAIATTNSELDDAAPLIPSLDLTGVIAGAGFEPDAAAAAATVESAPPSFTKAPSTNGLVAIASAGVIYGQSGSGFGMARPRLGLELEYRLGRKFAFSAGGFFNQVCYLTEEKNYKPKEGFWTANGDIRPEMVQGECNVLEIPLAAKYYLNGSANNSLYIGAGASTYLMLKEHYSYLYDGEVLPTVKKNWTERNSSNHFMGMGNFNVGYQKQLKGRSALKVEGFVQVPFTGIGHGDVRLLTTGISLNYQFDFRK